MTPFEPQCYCHFSFSLRVNNSWGPSYPPDDQTGGAKTSGMCEAQRGASPDFDHPP